MKPLPSCRTAISSIAYHCNFGRTAGHKLANAAPLSAPGARAASLKSRQTKRSEMEG